MKPDSMVALPMRATFSCDAHCECSCWVSQIVQGWRPIRNERFNPQSEAVIRQCMSPLLRAPKALTAWQLPKIKASYPGRPESLLRG